MKILLAYANGMQSPAICRTMLLSTHQVHYSCDSICFKLRVGKAGHACRMAKAVAIAWRLCLIHGDDIEGSSPQTARDIEQDILSYRQRSLLESKPNESWPELRERARQIALDYRASKRD